MRGAGNLLDRIDAIGRRVPLTAAVPLVGLYLVTCVLWAAGFEPESPALVLVFVPAWAPMFMANPAEQRGVRKGP